MSVQDVAAWVFLGLVALVVLAMALPVLLGWLAAVGDWVWRRVRRSQGWDS